MEKGTIFKFHNDLDTDQIIASQYLLLPNLDEMKGHTFESLDPEFRFDVDTLINSLRSETKTEQIEILENRSYK